MSQKTTAQPTGPAHAPETPAMRETRKPFVRPAVTEMGGLTGVTLLTGNV